MVVLNKTEFTMDESKGIPAFITFTGADQFSDIMGMRELSEQYPIEWGLLFSPDRQGIKGQNRYAPLSFFRDLVSVEMSFAAHLCGGDAKSVMQHGNSKHDEFLAANFERAQINTVKVVDLDVIALWARNTEISAIVQSRDSETFPTDNRVQWLYDASGGRGLLPKSWPAAHSAKPRFGYAGGLNPKNVAAVVAAIGRRAGGYYLDMETGVRDANDRFDLALCRRVCEAVYGQPKPQAFPYAA